MYVEVRLLCIQQDVVRHLLLIPPLAHSVRVVLMHVLHLMHLHHDTVTVAVAREEKDQQNRDETLVTPAVREAILAVVVAVPVAEVA